MDDANIPAKQMLKNPNARKNEEDGELEKQRHERAQEHQRLSQGGAKKRQHAQTTTPESGHEEDKDKDDDDDDDPEYFDDELMLQSPVIKREPSGAVKRHHSETMDSGDDQEENDYDDDDGPTFQVLAKKPKISLARKSRAKSKKAQVPKISDIEYPGWPRYSAITQRDSTRAIERLNSSKANTEKAQLKRALATVAEILLKDTPNKPKGWPVKKNLDNLRPSKSLSKGEREKDPWLKRIDEGKGLKKESDLVEWSKEHTPREWEKLSGIPWSIWRYVTPLRYLDPSESAEDAANGRIKDGDNPIVGQVVTAVTAPASENKAPRHTEPNESTDHDELVHNSRSRRVKSPVVEREERGRRLQRHLFNPSLDYTAAPEIREAQPMSTEDVGADIFSKIIGLVHNSGVQYRKLELENESKIAITDLPDLRTLGSGFDILENVIHSADHSENKAISRAFRTLKVRFTHFESALEWARGKAKVESGSQPTEGSIMQDPLKGNSNATAAPNTVQPPREQPRNSEIQIMYDHQALKRNEAFYTAKANAIRAYTLAQEEVRKAIAADNNFKTAQSSFAEVCSVTGRTLLDAPDFTPADIQRVSGRMPTNAADIWSILTSVEDAESATKRRRVVNLTNLS